MYQWRMGGNLSLEQRKIRYFSGEAFQKGRGRSFGAKLLSLSAVFLWGFFGSIRDCHAIALTLLGGYALPGATFIPAAGGAPAPFGLTFAALVDFQLIPSIHLETGGVYGPRGFTQSGVVTTFTTVQIPLVVRLYVVPSISFGLGGYFSHGIGTYTVGTLPVAYGFTTYGADDSGAIVSASLKVKLISIFGLVVDARYLYGLQNVNKSPGQSTVLGDFQFFGGLRIGK
jgi:hypothetical protein